eukprot:UN01163
MKLSWPTREVCVSPNQSQVAIAGSLGFVILNRKKRHWRSFGNDLEEEEFKVLCLAWYNDKNIIAAIANKQDDESSESVYSVCCWT